MARYLLTQTDPHRAILRKFAIDISVKAAAVDTKIEFDLDSTASTPAV